MKYAVTLDRYSSFPKHSVYKRKRLPQRTNEESDDILYYTPAAYVNSSGPVFMNHPSKYNIKRLKVPSNAGGKKVMQFKSENNFTSSKHKNVNL